jgi:hypothetical protein
MSSEPAGDFSYVRRIAQVFASYRELIRSRSYLFTNLGYAAFSDCTKLKGAYFEGNAPSVGSGGGSAIFTSPDKTMVYYLPGTTGWGSTFGSRPTALWGLPNPLILSPGFGVQTNAFGFVISWTTHNSVVVEASTNMTSSPWLSVGKNNLTAGSIYFSDPDWTNYPVRFYRIRSP